MDPMAAAYDTAYPPAMNRAAEEAMRPAGRVWPQYSEEFYWDKLLHSKPFRSVFAEDCLDGQPLIDALGKNLSQTPREQCELDGLTPGVLDREGPGQAVELHSLKSAPHLNGCRGRQLPSTGRGAPIDKPSADRIAVRLTTGKEVACRRENVKSIIWTAAAGSTAASNSSGAGTSSSRPAAAPTAAPAAAQRPPPTGRLADMVRADVTSNGEMPPRISRAALQGSGLQDSAIKCGTCGDAGQDSYVALARMIPLSSRPVPEAVQLQCIDCLIRTAEASGVRPRKEDVEGFVDSQVMGSCEACSVLMGHARMSGGGINLGEFNYY